MTGRPEHLRLSTQASDLEALLAAYAARRLAPTPGAMPRMRAALISGLETRGPSMTNVAPGWRASWGRRLVAAGLAASLVLGGAATVVTAGPSSPLYGARLWLETLTLPAAAADRAEAHRARLEARLDEAEAAAAAGNASAVAQALAAYRAEVEAALADVGTDAEQLARLEAALSTHLVVLDALGDLVPPQAADAIQKAADVSSHAVDKIKEQKARPSRPEPSNRPVKG